jgi:protoporphyrinogen/coproporphyrinogen III oxidase
VASAPLTIVIGAGISGLTCAYVLKKSGQNVLLLEASARSGGMIQSVTENGYLFELGPQSFSGAEAIFKLCDELGISGELVEAPRGAPRYILIDGKLVPVPFSPGAFLSSPLLSWRTKFSLLCEVFRTAKSPETDESVAAFVRAKFTPELLERVVSPFVSGIYAGDPESLSLCAAFPQIYEADQLSGSVIRGSLRLAKNKPKTQHSRRPGLYSFRKGNETLIRALVGSLGDALRCKTSVAAGIERDSSGFRLRLTGSQGVETLRADKLVLATPAFANKELLSKTAPAAGSELFGIQYAPVAVVSHGYREDQLRSNLQGFGFLIPRSAHVRTLGTVWNSSLFEGRAPQGHVLMTSFIGGAKDGNALALPPEELSAVVHREVSAVLEIQGGPAAVKVTPYWTAIPQYNLGHTKRLDAVRKDISQAPGLWVIGNYWKGPAIGACIEHSLAVAEEIRLS